MSGSNAPSADDRPPRERDRDTPLEGVHEIDLESETALEGEDLPNLRPAVAIAAVVGLVSVCVGVGIWWWRSIDAAEQQQAARQGLVSPGLSASPNGLSEGSGSESADRPSVKVGPVGRGTLSDLSEVTGTVVATPQATLRAAAPGTIISLAVAPGQTVKKGALLMQVRLPVGSDPQALRAAAEATRLEQGLEEAQLILNQLTGEIELQQSERATLSQEIATRQGQLAAQTKEWQRVQGLAGAGALARQEVEQARQGRDRAAAELAASQAQQANLEREIAALQARRQQFLTQTTAARGRLAQAQTASRPGTSSPLIPVNSPADGLIATLPVKPGQTVSAGQPLVTLSGDRSLRLRLQIPSDRASVLKPGLPFQATDDKGQLIGVGQIVAVGGAPPGSQSASPGSGSPSPALTGDREALAVVPQPKLRPAEGQAIKAKVLWQQRRDTVVAPKAALMGSGSDRTVFALERREDGAIVVRRRPVKTGLGRDNYIEILSGLTEQDAVAIEQLDQLKDGQAITPLLPPRPTAPPPAASPSPAGPPSR